MNIIQILATVPKGQKSEINVAGFSVIRGNDLKKKLFNY